MDWLINQIHGGLEKLTNQEQYQKEHIQYAHKPNIQDERDISESIIQQIIRHDFRQTMGMKLYMKCGDFIDKELGKMVNHYAYWLDYPPLIIHDDNHTANHHSHHSQRNTMTIHHSFQRMKGHKDYVCSLTVSDDGRYLFTGSIDGSIIMWDLLIENNAEEEAEEEHHHHHHPQYHWLAHRQAVQSLDYHSSHVHSHVQSDNHNNHNNNNTIKQRRILLASSSTDTTIRIWEMNNHNVINDDGNHLSGMNNPQRFFYSQLNGHQFVVKCVKFTNDGKFIVSGSADKTLRMWCVDNGECVRIMRGHTSTIRNLLLCNDNEKINLILSCSSDKTMRLWNLNNKIQSESSSKVISKWVSTEIYDISLNHNHSILACLCSQSIILYDWQALINAPLIKSLSKKQTQKSSLIGNEISLNANDYREIRDCPFTCSFHPFNPDILAVNCRDQSIKIYDISKCIMIHSFDNGHSSFIYDLHFTPNGQRLISVSIDKTAIIWDMSWI